MKISTFFFLTKQGVHNLGKHWAMTAACVGSLAVCLAINGVARLAEANVNSLVNYLGSQNETIVYLEPDATDDTAAQVGEALAAMQGVVNVQYMSKADVLSTYRGYMDEYATLWDDFEEDNPFQANYRVAIADLNQLSALTARMRALEGVEEVSAPIELSGIFLSIQRVVSYVGNIVVVVLMLVSLVTVSSTIRVSVYARRKEIEIMKYVGATNRFASLPFFVEGVIIGLLSGAVSVGAVLALYNELLKASTGLGGIWVMITYSMVPMEGVWRQLLASFLASGVIIGGLGSMMSIRRYLKV